MSTKERIEQTHQIGELEMQWLRGKPGELSPFATKHQRNFVEDPDFPDQRFRSRIHTHICDAKSRKGTPSLGDFYHISVDISNSSIRNWHIANISRMNKITGYFCMRATRKMVDAVKNRTDEEQALFNEIGGYL